MVGGGGPCDYCDSLSPKIRIWDFGLIFGTQTSDSGLPASDSGLSIVISLFVSTSLKRADILFLKKDVKNRMEMKIDLISLDLRKVQDFQLNPIAR